MRLLMTWLTADARGLRSVPVRRHSLVVTKLDRLARSLTDARNIVEELTEAGVKLNIGGSVHHPTDPVWRLLYNVLEMMLSLLIDHEPSDCL
jgi:DNA invertase Pin-like site-specific DNA recombinase